MALPSFLQRRPPDAPPAPVDDSPEVQAARTRARRRLIGAAVLLAAAVIGFPLLFETQPRPVPLDVPVEVAGRPAPPRAAAASAPRSAPRTSPSAVVAARDEPSPVAEPTASPASAGRVQAAAKPAASAASTRAPADGARARALLEGREPRVADRSEARAETRPDPKPDAKTEAKADPKADAKPERFVVQVGAYAEAGALREARQKVERLGLRTYTQEVTADGGKRTRVRIGPFATREEAEAARAKLRAAGLQPSVLSL